MLAPIMLARANQDNRNPQALAELRARIRAIETGSGRGAGVPLDVPAIDAWLPGGGLARGCLHELAGDPGAAAGFAALAAGRCARNARSVSADVLWIARDPDLYGPGLAALGLDPCRLVLVRVDHAAAVLWAMAEALRTPGLGAVVAELYDLDLTAGRRLQLAAEAGGVTGFALYPDGFARPTSAAVTRWDVRAAPSGVPCAATGGWVGRPRWRLDLLRCRGAVPASWLVELDDATGGLAVAAEPRDRPAAPARSAA